MAAWLPVLKAVLPYVANIVTTAVPVFTARRESEKSALVEQQIVELQQAARANAESIHVLAEQLQRSLEAIAAGAAAQDTALRAARRTARVSIAVAVLAVAIAAGALVAR